MQREEIGRRRSRNIFHTGPAPRGWVLIRRLASDKRSIHGQAFRKHFLENIGAFPLSNWLTLMACMRSPPARGRHGFASLWHLARNYIEQRTFIFYGMMAVSSKRPQSGIGDRKRSANAWTITRRLLSLWQSLSGQTRDQDRWRKRHCRNLRDGCEHAIRLVSGNMFPATDE